MEWNGVIGKFRRLPNFPLTEGIIAAYLSGQGWQENLKGGSGNVHWLWKNIRVRFVSCGSNYWKKGVVIDVVEVGVCDILVDESNELVKGVHQDSLVIALPKCGGAVVVVCGRHKGVYGALIDRDLEKETARIREADTRTLFDVKLEEVAEYTGDPADIGY